MANNSSRGTARKLLLQILLAPLVNVFALTLALPSIAAVQAEAGEVQEVARAVVGNTEWAADAQLCPTKIMARTEAKDHLAANHCKLGNLRSCLARCSAGTPSACYWLAYALQQQNASSESYEPLYQRACKLGIMSGCTNRAADMMQTARENETAKSCAAATFEAVCAFDDPWACTMSAFHLSRGIGTKQDSKRALKALKKSCKYGPDDEACIYAHRLRSDIEAQSRAKR